MEVTHVSPALAGGGKIEDGIDERLGKVGSFALNLRETHELIKAKCMAGGLHCLCATHLFAKNIKSSFH